MNPQNVTKTHDAVLVRFRCNYCNLTTSGIILPNLSASGRWCPRCRRPLVWCTHCCAYHEGESKNGTITCRKCDREVQSINYEFNIVHGE